MLIMLFFVCGSLFVIFETEGELLGESVTAIVMSIFWWRMLRRAVKEDENKNLAKVLYVPAMELDETSKFVYDKLFVLQCRLGDMNHREISHFDWENNVPKDCKEFTSEWHPSAEALIKAVKFHGRDLAILNKRNEIEIKV